MSRPPIPASHLAKALGYIINPLVLPFAVAFSIALRQGSNVAWIGAVSFGLFVAFPVGYLGWMVRSGRSVSVELTDPRERDVPYAMAAFILLIAMLLLSTRPSEEGWFAALVGTYGISTVLIFLVNRYWKISAHLYGLGTAISVLFFAPTIVFGLDTRDFAWAAFALSCLVFPLMWARVYTRAHTIAQTSAGVVSGAVLSPLIWRGLTLLLS